MIGVDAAYYLEELRYPAKEPLVAALVGFPMTLENIGTRGIKDIESCVCKLYFYFEGLDSGLEESPFAASIQASEVNSRAFSVYEVGNAAGAIDQFKKSGWYSSFADGECLSLMRKQAFQILLGSVKP